MNARILIVDDDADTRSVFRTKFEHSGYDVDTAGSAEDALASLAKAPPQVVITDLRMPGMSGLDLLERIKTSMDDVDVVLVTGHEDMSSAIAAMKAGAFDYVVKPVELKVLASLVERCLSQQALNREAQAAAADDEDGQVTQGSGVVGRDPRMIEIYKTIGVLSRNRTTVLVRGETGTGKEMIARAIHTNSARAEEPFIAVNCTALTDSLLESELFGHVKGAFTGAVSHRRGYFELAKSGTIFLDEIGDTSPEFQTKLLRVLQERQFYPVGGEEPKTTEARVIAADLAKLGEVDRVVEAVADLEIAILVNNAGVGYAGRFDRQTCDRLRDMVVLNCVAPVVLTSQLLPGMRGRGRGAVVVTGSVAGRQPLPLHGVYSATKAFDLLFGESLAIELQGEGIDVLVIEPGSTETEFQQVAGEIAHEGESPDDVVRVALDALGRQPSVVSGWFNWLRANAATRLLPRTVVAHIAHGVVAAQTPEDMR